MTKHAAAKAWDLEVIGGRRYSTGAPTWPAPGNLFTADYSSELGNWDSHVGDEVEGTNWRRTLVIGGGPGGVNSMRYEQLSSEDFNFGHRVHIAEQPMDGTPRFFRWCQKFLSTNNTGRHEVKTLFIGDSGETRFIFNAQAAGDSGPQFQCIFDGLAEIPYTDEGVSPYSNGVFIPLQLEVGWGLSGQAYFKIWIDTDVYASPTLELPSFSAENTRTDEISLGAYFNDLLGGGESYGIEHALFRISDSFDDNWASGMP